MFALRARRKVITEKDFIDAVQKVVSNFLFKLTKY
jgi:ATP-dependent 26S proteasome regulatory subunit